MPEKEIHGTLIANVCYERKEDVNPDDYPHRRIGAIIYYRSHEAQLRLDLIPAGAWADGVEYFIANFIPSEKVPEPPLIEGDLFATTEVRGDHVFCGHIHTRQKDSGETQYYAKINGLPIYQWKKIISADSSKSLYLKIRLD